MYGSVQAIFQYGITAPLRRHRRDPPLPPPERPRLQEIEDRGHMERGDMLESRPRRNLDEARSQGDQLCRSRTNKAREEPAQMFVETLRTAASSHTEHELHGKRPVRRVEVGQGDEPDVQSDSDSHAEAEADQRGGVDVISPLDAKTQTKASDCDSSLSEHPKDGNTREKTTSGLPQPQPKKDVQVRASYERVNGNTSLSSSSLLSWLHHKYNTIS